MVTKFLREGDLLLEVDLLGEEHEDDPWSPYFSREQAQKLYEAKKALVEGDWAKAQCLGRLFVLSPVNA